MLFIRLFAQSCTHSLAFLFNKELISVTYFSTVHRSIVVVFIVRVLGCFFDVVC